MMNSPFWEALLACPIEHSPLMKTEEGGWRCPACGFQSAEATAGGRSIPDFRAADRVQTVSQTFTIPTLPLDRYQVAQTHFHAIHQDFPHFSREEIRQKFGTKLDKGIQYYCQQVLRECGPDAPVLDLGCGNGGNSRYLRALGFRNVVPVDWKAAGAELLVDAHRLPYHSASFQMIISTAVFEHLYNPFLAMAQIGRVLKPGGSFVGGASFWEGWHGSSYFHLTPDGWNALLKHGGLELRDLWPGWGIIPAAFTHVLTPGHLRGPGYLLQNIVDWFYRRLGGEQGLRRMHLRASGAYQVFAQKS